MNSLHNVKVAARFTEKHSNSAEKSVINCNHGVVVEIVECITSFISGFVQPFEREIQALFNDFQAFHTTISSTLKL